MNTEIHANMTLKKMTLCQGYDQTKDGDLRSLTQFAQIWEKVINSENLQTKNKDIYSER